MAAVAWESVKAHLVAELPAVVGSGWSLYDGPTVEADAPEAYVMVGHAPSTETDEAGTFSQQVDPTFGYPTAEQGTVVCELGAITGGTTIPTVFGAYQSIADWLRSDMTLGGLLSPDATVTAEATVVQSQTTAGAVQRLVVAINYTTRLA